MSPPRAWLAVSLLALLGALNAYGEDGAPALPPRPVTIPLPPTHLPQVVEDPDELLLHQLARLIEERDRSIAVLPTANDGRLGRTPRIELRDLAAQEVLSQHAAARVALRLALDAAAARAGQGSGDILDRGRPRGQAAQLGPLSSANQLAIAECYKDLASTAEGTTGDIEAGLKALMSIDAGQLGDNERPRRLYLMLWFQLEGIRKLAKDAPAGDRANRLKVARDTSTELANQYPASALAQTSQALFAGLETP
jgi:hypothetical protein